LRRVSDDELKSLAEFRYELRRFLRVSENLCKAEGVTPLQYQLLLQTRSSAGRKWALVGELAHRLQTSPHGAVALVSRAQAAGLVTRVTAESDRRQVQVHATALGKRLMRRIAAGHLHELGALSKVFRKIVVSQAQ
jgi:DNA-binding MarR family transcriptional regulator